MAISKRHLADTSTSQDAVRAAREHDFTHAASHELRTPLTVMKVAVDVLADEAMAKFQPAGDEEPTDDEDLTENQDEAAE